MARFQSRDRFAEGEASKLSLLKGRPLRDEREPELTPAQKKVLKREYKKAAARMSGGVGSGWRRQAVVHVRITGVGRAEPAWEVGREPLEADEAGQLDTLAAKAGRLPRLWPSSLVAAGAFATCFAVVVIGRPGDRPASSADALTATVVATLPTLEVRRAAISRTPADNQPPAANSAAAADASCGGRYGCWCFTRRAYRDPGGAAAARPAAKHRRRGAADGAAGEPVAIPAAAARALKLH